MKYIGPAARRAGRRSALLKSKTMAASTTNLDQLKTDENNLEWKKRSMSVRDLNGEEFDFSNKDSVTRWTSQILAELNSLPTSCADLTQPEKIEKFPEFSGKIDWNSRNRVLNDVSPNVSTYNARIPNGSPTKHCHQNSMSEQKKVVDSRCNRILTTSPVVESFQYAYSPEMDTSSKMPPKQFGESHMTSSIDNVKSWISSFENLMTSSFHNMMYHQNSTSSTRSNIDKMISRNHKAKNDDVLVAVPSSKDCKTTPVLTQLPIEKRSEAQKPIPVRRTTTSERDQSNYLKNSSSTSLTSSNHASRGVPTKKPQFNSPKSAPQSDVPTPKIRQRSVGVVRPTSNISQFERNDMKLHTSSTARLSASMYADPINKPVCFSCNIIINILFHLLVNFGDYFSKDHTLVGPCKNFHHQAYLACKQLAK
ncbi:hypothetical protein DICVIV_07044 [Dictyocaulus viviparus]|uniref:Uncharacterized protein n=1 Tax=Dictyocaulus viviparus TaxID=29172 RepID=A0A0D8XSW0_DICVI|nr:hypothetical protein DICVIV_07044 [Dictyocaulus viviparus]